MSGAVTAVTVAAAAYSAYSSNEAAKKQEKAQKQAMQQQQQLADRQAKTAEQQFNRQNQKKPDIGSIMQQNARAGEAGSTMLTGPSGVSNDQLSLGRSTLLGG